MLRRLIVIGFLLSTMCAGAFTVRSVADTDWENPATWSSQQVPNNPDTIFVDHYVTFNQSLTIHAPTVLVVDSGGTLCGDYLLNISCGSVLINYGHMYLNQLIVRAGSNYNLIWCKNSFIVQGCPPSGTGYFHVTTGGQSTFSVWPPVACRSRDTNWNPTGINEFEKSGLSAFPNPAQNELTVKSEGEVNISLTDVFGEELFSGKAFQYTTIDLSMHAPGVYFLQARQNGRTYSKKILKIN